MQKVREKTNEILELKGYRLSFEDSATKLQPAKCSIAVLYFRVRLPAQKSMYCQPPLCAFDDAFNLF